LIDRLINIVQTEVYSSPMWIWDGE